MASMEVAEQRRISRLLQVAADQLAAGIPDRVGLAMKAGSFMLDADVWTSAMTREHLALNWDLGTKKAVEPVIAGSVSWDDAAPAIVEELIGPMIAIQEDRWRLASAFGLVQDGVPRDLSPSGMLVDRSLLAMLSREGLDVRRAATQLAAFKDFQVGDELPSITIGADRFFARQLGVGLPVLSSWVTLGREPYVRYDGTYLALDGPLPNAVMNSASGHRLGNVVATGVPGLNARVIAGIFDFGEHPHGTTTWEEALMIYIQLAPDHVTLGAPE